MVLTAPHVILTYSRPCHILHLDSMNTIFYPPQYKGVGPFGSLDLSWKIFKNHEGESFCYTLSRSTCRHFSNREAYNLGFRSTCGGNSSVAAVYSKEVGDYAYPGGVLRTV